MIERLAKMWSLESVGQWLEELGAPDWFVPAVLVLLVVIGAIIANTIAKRVIVRLLRRIIERTETRRDDLFVERKVFDRLSHLAPGLVIYWAAPAALARESLWIPIVQKFATLYMAVVVLWVVLSLLDALLALYQSHELSKRMPLKSFFQVAKLIAIFVAGILILSMLLDKSPRYFLTGVGALGAVLMLVFKDPILGLVGGIQLTANEMLRPGDWIEMPRYGADGDVIDISLTTVKVRNFDHTITTIPTYALISESFKNWRGMSESGARRIKRSIAIDVSSIRFVDGELLDRFRKIRLLRDYLEGKRVELEEANRSLGADVEDLANGRRLTNIGTFRAYAQAYVDQHPGLDHGLTCMVRQLAPSEHGLPIELYIFATDTRWVHYEQLAADIFDHLLAVVPEFDLRVYQRPAGADFRAVGASAAD